MKSKLLPRIWSGTMCALCGFILPFFSCSPLLANNTNPPVMHTAERLHPAEYKASNFQNTAITGKITDENGNGIPGANVLEKGTNNGVISDADGNYRLNVRNRSSILVVSFVGYATKEIRIGTQSNINVQLASVSQSLDDVVVVGYGTQKRSELTNAVVQTTGAEIKKSTNLSVSNSLAGRLPGLYVSQQSASPGFDDAQILVRGAKTYRNTSALIVIDGVANADPDGLNRLDPNDIESISVLKDASAAIYGTQSAGGVILVTTKRGKAGKAAFDFSSTFGWQSPAAKVKSGDVFEYIDVLNKRRELEGTTPDFPQEVIDAFKNGTRRAENWYAALVDPPAPQNRQSITMRGGTDKIRYFVSLGTAYQGGIMRGDNKTQVKQYNVRSNIDVSVTDNFEVGFDLSGREKYTELPQSGPGGDVGAFASTSPLQEAYIGGDYRYPGEGWSHLNPVARLESPGYRKYKGDVLSGTLRFKWNIPYVEGLTLDGFSSLVKGYEFRKVFNYVWPYYERDPGTGEIVKKQSRTVEDIGLREDFYQSQRITNNIKLSYNTVINNDHKIGIFVAYEQMDYKEDTLYYQRLGYDSPLIDQLFAGSSDRSNWNGNGIGSENARRNYFGRISYEFKSKYLLGFSARYDGSTIFSKNSRYGFFPQASAAWVVSKESFIPQNIFSNFKIRASWGKLGNDRVNPFQYIARFAYAPGWVVNGVDARGLTQVVEPNPNITWEITESTDLGLELGFLQNSLTFELDLYKNKTSNILGRRQASIPDYTGLVLPDENIGRMDNQGFEFQAGYRHTVGNVNLRFNGNIGYTENKIVYFDEKPQAEPYQKLEGQPIGSALVYKSIGIYRTEDDLDKYPGYPGASLGGLIFADLNNDGEITSNDEYMFNTTAVNTNGVINVYPKFQFGLNIGADYKDFDFSMLFAGQSGAKWRLSNGFNSGAGGNGLRYVALNSFSLDDTNAELPMISPTGFANSNSDFYYHSSTWLRLKTAQLGYTLPGNLMTRFKISALRLYVSGDNLFMVFNNLKKYGAGDPETAPQTGNGGVYPIMRTVSAGLNITF
ncbi:TonB-dependent receptor [Agriterribacter sp.]|uniref:SusC/RagA family TonB-linked outer membrane protein n=1 Tax=Agriterribacter sp. TaxID=2821509 RepID=UPI002CC18032|nr:TonB-dependent receptor [Agriterribacter sp.]HTN05753.1 TonB-dependent receptor [Agriterribacter sp.]